MILTWGPQDDPPLERVVAALRRRSVGLVHVDDTELASLRYEIVLGDRPTGWIEQRGTRTPLARIRAVYLRPGEPTSPAAAPVSAALLAVAARLPVPVVNRPAAGASNMSKPHQLTLIAAAGLTVPPTLVTTDPGQARRFLEAHGRLVYKSVSGVRSIVATLERKDSKRLDGVTTGPVQLQRWIDGIDVRVHVVGDRWFATAIESRADDYRYAARQGAAVTMREHEIPARLGKRLVALTRRMDLLVSGIDLRIAADGTWYCFEVNPSPGFTFYEDETGQPITEAIADLLIDGT